MNGHRSSVKNNSTTYLYEHFNLPGHSFSDATIQIIDFVDNSTSDDVKNDLLITEDYWIDRLGTTYPLGLNDKKKGSGNVSQGISMNYFNGTIKRYKRGRGKKRTSRHRSLDGINSDIAKFSNPVTDFDNKSLFKTFKRYSLKDLDLLYSLSKSNSGIIYNICLSFSSTFSPKHRPKESVAKDTRENIVIKFKCKFIDNLKLPSIFSDTSVQKLLPQAVQKVCPLMIFYKYNDPLSLSILNYGKFLKKLTIPDIRSIIHSPCDCSTSPFLYGPLEHVVTGDLSIVVEKELREILSYGCKYRVPINLTSQQVRDDISEDIDSFIKIKSRKYFHKHTAFTAWRDRVMEIVDKRIKFFNKHHPHIFQEQENILEKVSVKKELKRLQKKYIICSVDKASNNISFICKKFYILTLLKELGFDLNTLECTGNDTYQPCELKESEVVDNICNNLLNKFNIKVGDDDQRLARLFWNPKLHKVPYKARFIAGAKKCATKPLNILVNCALKLLRDYFKRYCQTIYNNSGINMFWSIESSLDFLKKLRNTDVYNLQIYDFTTLYTKLDLREVDKMIWEVIDLIFSERNKYICICKYDNNKCFFSKKLYDNYHCFDKFQLKEAVHFIISNTYIVFGGTVFIQIMGIPMGGNSSSPIADLTLAKFEFNYMQKLLTGKKFALAKHLSNTNRYVDDLITFNYLHFHNLINVIYPPSLQMERSGSDNKIVNYLDLNVSIKPDGISVSVYNKTDDFNFNVVSLTFPHSNIPIEVGYNVFYGQILRYGNICTDLDTFTFHLNKIFQIMVSRNYDREYLIKSIRRCLRKYNSIFCKFGIQDDTQILHVLT